MYSQRASSSTSTLVEADQDEHARACRAAAEVGLSGTLFRQRLQIGDNVLPVFLVRHEVDHLRAPDELAGALEIFVQVRCIPGDVQPLHCRRIVIAGLRPALAANDGPNLFSPGLFEWQGTQWAKTFSPAAASPCAYAVSGTESAPADASMIE